MADRSKTLALITPIPCSRRTYHQHYRYMTSPGLPRRPIRRGRSCALTVGGRNDIERPVAREWQNAAVDATSWLAGRARGVAVGRHEQKGIDRGMTIQRLSIPIVETTKQNGPVPVDLVEAMSALAGARSTRTIIKAYKAAGVTSNLIIPLVSDCPVDSARLGRAMRSGVEGRAREAKAVTPYWSSCDLRKMRGLSRSSPADGGNASGHADWNSGSLNASLCRGSSVGASFLFFDIADAGGKIIDHLNMRYSRESTTSG